MAPRRNVIIGHLDGVQPPIRRSSRKVRQAPNEVIIGRLEPPASGTQPSGSRERTQTNNEVNIQEPTDLPLQEDVLEAVDDLDDQPGAKVCAFMAQYLICDLTIIRHQWEDGSSFVIDISTCYWRCKDLPWILPAPYAANQWRSNVMTALVPTTFVGLAALMHISGPHIIAYCDGLAVTSSPCLCISWGSSYILAIMACHVPIH